MKLDILYEDNHIIVAYKPIGVLSQSDGTNTLDMLSLIKDYIKVKYNKPNDVFLGLVHRLDRNTSGVMIFARTSKAAKRLQEAMNNNGFHKSYLAIVEGNLKVSDNYILLKDKLFKDERQNKSFVSNKGLEAMLEYKVLANKDNKSLIDIHLLTGRHHQIRCQFSNICHPLVGDLKYGSKYNLGNYYALQSYKLSVIHPTLKENMTFYKLDDTHEFKNFQKELKNISQ